ncbi:MAG: hypothetical protein ACE15E_03840 [Acidobacteriota bacterium]
MLEVTRLDIAVYRIATNRPEVDGTFSWSSTTAVLVEVFDRSGKTGLDSRRIAVVFEQRAAPSVPMPGFSLMRTAAIPCGRP